jgi:hypothetical protein
MSKKTNKQKSQTKFALRRLAEDEEVHAHLRTAAVRIREAWTRASGRPAAQAVEDKKIYDKAREAAVSLTRAGQKLRPKPEPPKHRVRNAALIAAGAGGAAFAIKKRRDKSAEETQPASSSATGDQPPATVTAAPG